MRLSAQYDEMQCPSETVRKYAIRLMKGEQVIDYYETVIDMSTDIYQINIDLPLIGVIRYMSMPLVFSCLREIISKEVGSLTVHYDCDYETTRNKKGRLIISGCGYGTCATVDERDSEFLIKIMVMKDAINDIRILQIVETECSLFTHNRVAVDNKSLYKEALIEFLTEQCLDLENAYYRPKQMLLHGYNGLHNLSISELEEDVKLWFGNTGIGVVHSKLKTKIEQCERS